MKWNKFLQPSVITKDSDLYRKVTQNLEIFVGPQICSAKTFKTNMLHFRLPAESVGVRSWSQGSETGETVLDHIWLERWQYMSWK
jgi:hypothetical protein